ncbi:MAG: phenylacetic acid degradation bifunctional protein PaaZ, partial [Actinomyces sp.]
INAFNFPCWGMLEKLAPALLAGVPAIVKPASATAHLTEAMFRQIVESGILPPGAVQLVCGSVGDLFDHLGGGDLVSFTGSATTAARLRAHPAVVERAVRFNAEADSLNAAVLGRSVGPDDEAFARYVDLVATEMRVKAGQKCTAVRRAIVPSGLVDAVVDALGGTVAGWQVGDPADPTTDMGPLVSLDQRREVERSCAELSSAADPVVRPDLPAGLDTERGAWFAPTLFVARERGAAAVHEVEAFGPVCTVIAYDTDEEAVELVARGGGSLVASLVTDDRDEAARLNTGIASHHGRVHVLDAACAAASTGHGSPLPHLVHGGPGRAGGGEELGGLRGVYHHMQRTAVQGSPDLLTAVTGRWMPGATRRLDRGHPFTLHFDELEVGDALDTEARTVTIDDIEAFAELTGDHFYAHMDDEAAKASPIFEGRVAHGYFVVSAAAGLFVWPDPGPVLANYGLENLRFATPTYPGDTLRVRFTCAEKTPRPGTGYGEVRWFTEVLNQNDEVVASYDVLTMVAESGAAAT